MAQAELTSEQMESFYSELKKIVKTDLIFSKMESFYITVPCERNFIITNPTDKIEDFTTILPQMFTLEGNWEVGLTEVTFPKSWVNIPYKQSIELVYFDENNEDTLHDIIKDKDVYIEAANYSIDDLVKKCNELIYQLLGKNEKNELILKGYNDKVVTIVPQFKKSPML